MYKIFSNEIIVFLFYKQIGFEQFLYERTWISEGLELPTSKKEAFRMIMKWIMKYQLENGKFYLITIWLYISTHAHSELYMHTYFINLHLIKTTKELYINVESDSFKQLLLYSKNMRYLKYVHL